MRPKPFREHRAPRVPLSVAAAVCLALTACGGGGSNGPDAAPGGDGSGFQRFDEPRDALVAATFLPSQLFAQDISPSLGPTCADGGSMTRDSITVASPYADGGSLPGTRVVFDDCAQDGERLNGEKTFAKKVGDDAKYARMGTETGEPLILEDANYVIAYQGEAHSCGTGCATVNGVPVREVRSDLGFDAEAKDGDGGRTFVRGTEERPLVRRWREDYPAAGQMLFWLDGYVASEWESGCRAAATFSVPDDARTPVLSTSGGGLFESGLLRLVHNDSAAEVVFTPSEIVITVDGVSETFTWEQAGDYLDENGCFPKSR